MPKDYSNSIIVNVSVTSAFKALTKQIDSWWISSANAAYRRGDTLKLSYQGTYKAFVVTEIIPLQKIVWRCVDVFLNVPALRDKKEWINTRIIWDLIPVAPKLKIHLTHEGLNPSLECYQICEPTWDYFLNESLCQFLTSGKGKPLQEN